MRIQHYLTLLCFTLLGMASLQAQTVYIGPNNGSWFTDSYWTLGLPAAGNNAQISGGVTVVVGSPLTVDFAITNFGGIVATAAITIQSGGSFENSGTLSGTAVTNNGTFQNFGTATLTGPANFINETGATFTNSGSFTLQTTLVNRGAITNNGTIDAANGTLQTEGTFNNSQTLTTKSLTVTNGSTFTNNFGSNLNITGASAELTVNGNFDNFGTINAAGAFTVNGTLNNNSAVNITGILTVNAGATFNNANGTVNNGGGVQVFGTFINGFQFVNNGSANNFGQFNNNNVLDNKAGATFNNRPGGTFGMGFGSQLLNAGTFNNQAAFNSFGAINNTGTYSNSGTIVSFSGAVITNGATFTNSGEMSTNDQVNNNGNFTNNGVVNANAGSVWTNNSTLNNAVGGTINVIQDFVNKASATLTNNGRFSNRVRTRNEGNFTNNAFLENIGDFTNTTGATLTNNELLLQSSGNILNQGTIANTDHLLNDECSSINNKGSINNTGNFELHGILFQTGTLTGTAVNNQGGYVHTSATSNAPTVCHGGTFGADIHGEIKVYASELVSYANFDSCANIIYLANGIGRPVFHCSDIGSVITVNLVVRTRLGDSLTCTAPVTPVDILEPQFDDCPKDIVVFTPNAAVNVSWTAPIATDNCTTVNLTASHTPGSSFPVGITGVTYTAKDTYNNENNCQFRVDVRQTPPGSNCTGDNTAPTFANCPSNISLTTNGNGAIASWTPPTPSDNCKPLFLTSSHVPGQSFGIGVTTVTYTAKDGNNNTGTCSFTVTVTANDPCLTDNQAPSFVNCPANIYAPTNAAINGAVAIWNAPSAFDLCGVASVTSTHQPGSVFPTGTTNVTYTAVDNSGNSGTCNFVITVGTDPCPDDTTPPVVSGCPANITLLTNGNSAVANWTAPTASDPCSPITVNKNYTPGSTFPLGNTTVTYQFSDGKGNKSTCSFTVTVNNACSVDNVAPVITGCPANITVPAVNGSAVANWTAPTASDNCGLAVFSASFLPGASFPIGTTTVVYSAIDLKGNTASCQFNVNVVNAPGCTTNASPINGSTNVNPASVALSWNAVLNASSYDVYLGTTNPPTTVKVANVTGTSATVTGLANGTVYYWYVLPKNSAGSPTGCTSSTTNFTTSGSPGGGTGGCNKDVLFVVGSTALNASDATIKNGLQSMGLNVTVVDDAASKTSDATNKALVLISSTCNSTDVNIKFRNVTVPVICYESQLYDDMKMTKASTSYYGNSTNEYKITIVNSSHPIAMGLSGNQNIFNSYQTVTWGRPSAGATIIGREYGSSVRSLLFAYDSGASMEGLTAPAKRIGLFLYDDNADNLTNEGLQLCYGAVSWATGIQLPGSACNDGNANTTNDVIQSDGCTCAGTPICDGNITGYAFNTLSGGSSVTLINGGSYALNSLPASFNIETFATGTFESISYQLSGASSLSHIENLTPYRFPGDDVPLALVPGNYTLSSTFYSQDGGVGAVCNQQSISFTILPNDPCAANPPVATVTTSSASCNQSNGSITFTFPNNPSKTNIEFSINNGSTYPYNVLDNAGSTTVSNLAPGTYQTWVRWGDDSCPKSLGSVTVQNTNVAPVAVCKNITLQLVTIGQSVQINGQQLDNGSTPGCGTILTFNASPTSFSQPGTYTATLTVTNSLGQSASCTSTVTVNAPATAIDPTKCYKIIAKHSGKAMTIQAGATSNGAAIVQNTYTGAAYQIWKFEDAGNGFYRLKVQHSNKYFNLKGDPTHANGATGEQWSFVDIDDFYWKIESDGSGSYRFKLKNNLGKVLDISGASLSEDAAVLLWDQHTGDNQRWQLVEVPCPSTSDNVCPGTAGTGLMRQVWSGIAGTLISNLTTNANYPDNPTTSNVYASSVGPWGVGDNYGTRVRGFIKPTQSGNYKFVVTGDDQTELYLSTTGSPASKVKIAYIDGWTNATEYNKYASQTSASISLTAGQSYYVEMLHKEGGGGDGWGIYWIKPGTSSPTAIPTAQLTPAMNCNDACNPDVLFVVGSTSLNNGDAWVKSRLEQLGYSVEVKSDNYVRADNATGKGLIVISSTSNSANIGSMFTNVSVPVITWEPYLYGDLKMASSIGSSSSQYRVTINDASHPVAAGLSGNVNVYNYYGNMNWGWISSTGNDAAEVVRLYGESSKYGILAFDKNSNMIDGFKAPERRVSFFIDDNSAVYLNSTGVKLFDAAINWAARCNGVGERSELLILDAWKDGFDTELQWLSSEGGKDEAYIIERSADGIEWSELLTVEAKVGDKGFERYNATDFEPLDGHNFYRLIVVKNDASLRYSDMQDVLFVKTETYSVFPNPAKDRLYFDLSSLSGKEVLIRLFDSKGVTVQEWETTATDDPIELKLNTHNSGQYMLWMYTKDRRPVTKKIVLDRN